jgi:hypothetical protein
MRHPFSEAIALDYAAMLYAFRGDNQQGREYGKQAAELCSRHGFAYYLAMANVVTGWAGQDLPQLREGLEGMRRLGAEIRLPYYYALLAEALGHHGSDGEALASISTGLAFATKNRESWPISELHRVHGKLLASQGKAESARASFQRGIEAARLCGSLAFERKLSILADRTAAAASTERS